MSVIDVSSTLGEYMLKGWVLTDETCPNENCPVPLMRSPKGHSPVSMFCANCDGGPRSRRTSVSGSAQSPSYPRQPSPSTVSSSTRISRSSTPPTDISSGLSSPTFALPAETAESVRRRQQSDAASAEIGARLLKGWAMLADECPNVHCYGVPLVRPPLVGGKDPRKECVACGTIYIDEKDAAGWEHLVTAKQQAPSGSTALAGPSSGDAMTFVPTSVQDKGKGKASTYSVPEELIRNAQADVRNINDTPSTTHSQTSVLEVSSASLELALRVLSQRLTSLASHPVAVEPSAIGNIAEAMTKVLQALSQVGKLRGDRVDHPTSL